MSRLLRKYINSQAEQDTENKIVKTSEILLARFVIRSLYDSYYILSGYDFSEILYSVTLESNIGSH